MTGVEKNIADLKCLVLIMNKKLVFSIVVGVMVCLSVGFLAGQATQTSVNNWYASLKKPFLIHTIGFLLRFGHCSIC